MTKHWIKRASLLPISCLALGIPAAMADHLDVKERAVTWTHTDKNLKWGACPAIFPTEGCQVAVLHGDPSKENADVFLKVQPKTKLVAHWHTSAERMILVAGELHVGYENQTPVVMKAGTYAYGPEKLGHTAECGDAGECILFIAFEKPVDAVSLEGKPAAKKAEAKPAAGKAAMEKSEKPATAMEKAEKAAAETADKAEKAAAETADKAQKAAAETAEKAKKAAAETADKAEKAAAETMEKADKAAAETMEKPADAMEKDAMPADTTAP